jgi:IS30 family transposase
MKEGWSPEQISGRMGLIEIRPVSHETIYKYIYHNKRSGGKLYLLLRHKNKKYTKRVQTSSCRR